MSRRWLPAAAAAVAGLAAGALAKAADEAPGLSLVGSVLTGVAAWLLAAALLARFGPNPRAAALRVALFFVAMCLGYFGYASVVLDFPPPGRYALAWGLVSVTVMPALAALYRWAAGGSGRRHGLAVAAVAATASGYGATVRAVLLWDSGLPLADLAVPALVELAVCAVVAAVLPEHRRTRRTGAIALLPMLVLVQVAARWFLDRAPLF